MANAADRHRDVPRKVAFLFTHRIQYFTNVLDELHRRGKIEVAAFYAHETKRIEDAGFGRRIEWDNRCEVAFPEVVLSDSAARSHGSFHRSFSTQLSTPLRRFAPDVVHLNGYNNAIQWLGWIWSKRQRVPMLGRGDGDTIGQPLRSRSSLQSILARRFARGLAHVFYQGAENRAFWGAREVAPERMSWIPCVSDGRTYRPAAFVDPVAREHFRQSCGAGPDEVVFVVSGKLEARKRPADALEALARCESGAARLWFLGSGPLESELRSLAAARGISERVHWFGFRNQSEIPAVLQAADVLLHPSQQDPWPYSILEGAISGLALLLSDHVGSHPDWIAGASAGLVFRCGDVAHLAHQIREMTAGAAQRHAFAAAARRASAKYTEEEFCERFEGVVGELLSSTITPR